MRWRFFWDLFDISNKHCTLAAVSDANSDILNFCCVTEGHWRRRNVETSFLTWSCWRKAGLCQWHSWTFGGNACPIGQLVVSVRKFWINTICSICVCSNFRNKCWICYHHVISWGPSVWSLQVLSFPAWVLSRYSSFLPQSKNMQGRLTSDFKLPVGVNMTVNGCLSLHMLALRLTGDLSRMYPSSCPMSAEICSTPTRPSSLRLSRKENEWKNRIYDHIWCRLWSLFFL